MSLRNYSRLSVRQYVYQALASLSCSVCMCGMNAKTRLVLFVPLLYGAHYGARQYL